MSKSFWIYSCDRIRDVQGGDITAVVTLATRSLFSFTVAARHRSVFNPDRHLYNCLRLVVTVYYLNRILRVKNICIVKKRGVLPNPQKKVPEISKSIQRGPESQKTDKKIYETFKGSSRVSRGRTFSYENFF
jgi:hypothetical protein